MLPWYVLVQLRNPEFFRVFILEHNLARFSQDAYHHRQPFWFYLPVFLLAMMPWAVVFLAAAAERARLIWSEGKEAYSGADTDDSWALFLLIWTFVPVLFFSASQSKLPGYILPAVPAGALLVADYLSSRRAGLSLALAVALAKRIVPTNTAVFPLLFAAAHGILCGLLLFGALSSPSIVLNHRLLWGKGTYIAAAVGVLFALGHGRCFAVALGPTVAASRQPCWPWS